MRDFTLIREIASGNIAALDTLYEKYRADVYRLAYMMTRHPQTAEDVMQDVFLAVVRGAPGFQKDISVKGWILTITRNTAINMLRHGARVYSVGEEIEWLSDGEAPDPFAFSELLSELSASEQEIIILHIVYGHGHKEIAKMLSIKHDTVRKQYQRALKKLRNSFEIERRGQHAPDA